MARLALRRVVLIASASRREDLSLSCKSSASRRDFSFSALTSLSSLSRACNEHSLYQLLIQLIWNTHDIRACAVTAPTVCEPLSPLCCASFYNKHKDSRSMQGPGFS